MQHCSAVLASLLQPAVAVGTGWSSGAKGSLRLAVPCSLSPVLFQCLAMIYQSVGRVLSTSQGGGGGSTRQGALTSGFSSNQHDPDLLPDSLRAITLGLAACAAPTKPVPDVALRSPRHDDCRMLLGPAWVYAIPSTGPCNSSHFGQGWGEGGTATHMNQKQYPRCTHHFEVCVTRGGGGCFPTVFRPRGPISSGFSGSNPAFDDACLFSKPPSPPFSGGAPPAPIELFTRRGADNAGRFA